MEDDLDDIASGSEEQVPWLERFYFGEHRPGAVRPARAAGRSLAVDGTHGLKEAVSLHLDEIDAREVNSIPLATDAEGREIVIRVGRYGPYLQRGEDRAAVPGDLAPDELTLERAEELLEHPSTDRVLGADPVTGKTVLVRAGRFGPYVQLGEAAAAADKPRTASLLKTMSAPDVTLEQALQILKLPRAVGTDPETGEEIVAANGRFGPFLKRGSETRSLETEDQLFTVTIEEALSLFSAPKQRRYGTSAAPLRELGADRESGSAIVLRSGRFGLYVSDGTTNASLRRGDDPEELTLERALELDRGAPGRRAREARRGPQDDRRGEEGGRPQGDRREEAARPQDNGPQGGCDQEGPRPQDDRRCEESPGSQGDRHQEGRAGQEERGSQKLREPPSGRRVRGRLHNPTTGRSPAPGRAAGHSVGWVVEA